MRMKILSAAVLAGLGVAGTTQAVHVNPDGLGQALIYPYYSVQNGFDTYVHVVNTTSQVKAVKVRFLEGKNSQEVLDFNLYLSPYDEWTGVVTRTDDGAGITSSDTSCIAPQQLPALGEAPQEFRNFVYAGDSVNGTDRTREGYVELIEMGVVADATLAAAATHTQGGATSVQSPANCGAVRSAASAGGALNNNPDGVVTQPTGGLYGFASLINVQAGTKTSVDAVALDDFYAPLLTDLDLHTSPGNTQPGLDQVDPLVAHVLDGTVVRTSPVAAARPNIDAVSFTMMQDAISNDYAVDAERDARTDWVITFPTKRYYVNGAIVSPFNEAWNTVTSTSCDPVTITYRDREEQVSTVTDDFSPPPPAGPATQLCNEVNTLSVRPSGAPADYNTVYGAEFTNASFSLDPGFEAGWMRVAFTGGNSEITDGNGVVYQGLPVVGFSSITNLNGTIVVDGVNVQSNYLSSITHKGTRVIQ